MSDIIQNKINSILKDGARPSKFRMELTLPDIFGSEAESMNTICKTVSFPMKTNEVIMLKHKGRSVPIPGQEKFGHVIAITMYADDMHKYRVIFQDWIQALNYENYTTELSKNTTTLKEHQAGDLIKSKGTMKVTQLNFDGDLDKISYTFYGIFPKEIDAMALGSETISTVSEVSCSFSYTYYTVETKNEDGSNSNDVANAILGEVQGIANKVVDYAMGFIPGLDKLDSAASKANTMIQDAGKSVSNTIDEFLG